MEEVSDSELSECCRLFPERLCVKMKADPEESIKQFEDESFWLNSSASENLSLLLELENSGTVFGHKVTGLRGVRLLLGGDFPLPVLFGVTVW